MVRNPESNGVLLLGLIILSTAVAVYGFFAPSRVPFGTWRMYSGLAMNACLIEFYKSDDGANFQTLNRFEAQGVNGREDLLSKELFISSEVDAQSQVDRVCEANKSEKLYVSFWCRENADWKALWLKRSICDDD